MCGISGLVFKKPQQGLERYLSAMSATMRHRGPDDSGIYIDDQKKLGLAHNRLSIIDLSQAAKEPMFNEDESVVMVFNGEIYNYLDLRQELISCGHTFRSRSDSEVIIHAYEEWGDDCVLKFRGMFAFCILDKKESRLLLARDHIGIKPLYYLDTPGIFSFASEAKAFGALKHSFWEARVNDEALRLLLAFPYIPDCELTLLEGVKKLPPGHVLVFDNSFVTIKKYWSLERKPEEVSLAQALERLEAKLKESVRLHLQSDVPLGVLLSGGLDSSLICALAKGVSNRKINTFTVGYDHPLDERKYAGEVAAYLGTEHSSLRIDPASLNDRIDEIIGYYDDLTTLDGGIISNYVIAEEVRKKGVKVALVGEGADEVFCGYSWYGLSVLPFKFFPAYMKAGAYFYAVSRRLNLSGVNYVNNVFKGLHEPDTLRRISGFEITRQLPNNYLMKVDKATMAHSLEARVPYLDKEVVEFAYNLPAKFKFNCRWFNMKKPCEKYILRLLAKKYLPENIANRKKQGFSIPVYPVLKSRAGKVKEYLLDSRSEAVKLMGKNKVASLFDFKETMYSPFNKEKETLVWKFFMIEAWKRKFIYN